MWRTSVLEWEEGRQLCSIQKLRCVSSSQRAVAACAHARGREKQRAEFSPGRLSSVWIEAHWLLTSFSYSLMSSASFKFGAAWRPYSSSSVALYPEHDTAQTPITPSEQWLLHPLSLAQPPCTSLTLGPPGSIAASEEYRFTPTASSN